MKREFLKAIFILQQNLTIRLHPCLTRFSSFYCPIKYSPNKVQQKWQLHYRQLFLPFFTCHVNLVIVKLKWNFIWILLSKFSFLFSNFPFPATVGFLSWNWTTEFQMPVFFQINRDAIGIQITLFKSRMKKKTD